MIYFYSLVLWLLLPYVFLRLIWRARIQPEYLQHISERFGFYDTVSDKPVIWLHAVSVGETRATQSLVIRLQTEYPHYQILITHTTPTGRATSKLLYSDSVLSVYLPYDYPFAVKGFLRHFQPRLGVLMETEIWFNLIRACRLSGIPLLLLNARMSERSARGYARFARLTRAALNNLAAVAAQSEDDATRLRRLGANHVSVMGNLKFDINPPFAMFELGTKLREQFGTTRKILLAASTREGEEALLLDELENLHIAGFLLVIVPRHPQRFSVVATLLEHRRISFFRRSEMAQPGISHRGNFQIQLVPSDVQVVLGDTMGEMFAYYAAADLAFIGGSLLPFGGQNLIEACAIGTPVLIGPHTYNFSEVTRLAVSAGAAVQVADVPGLVAEVKHLFQDSTRLQNMHRQCVDFVESNRGATEKSLQLIKQNLQ